jgi:hypothetical protein
MMMIAITGGERTKSIATGYWFVVTAVPAFQWRLTIRVAVARALTRTSGHDGSVVGSGVLHKDQCSTRWRVAVIDRIDIATTTTRVGISTTTQSCGSINVHLTSGHGTQVAAFEAIQTKLAVPIGIAIALTFAQWKQ